MDLDVIDISLLWPLWPAIVILQPKAYCSDSVCRVPAAMEKHIKWWGENVMAIENILKVMKFLYCLS